MLAAVVAAWIIVVAAVIAFWPRKRHGRDFGIRDWKRRQRLLGSLVGTEEGDHQRDCGSDNVHVIPVLTKMPILNSGQMPDRLVLPEQPVPQESEQVTLKPERPALNEAGLRAGAHAGCGTGARPSLRINASMRAGRHRAGKRR